VKNYKTKNPNETRIIAKKFAEDISKSKNTKRALVVGLTGELGAGKTTFIKSFIKSMGVKKRITSPTFLIQRRLSIKHKTFKNIFHIDAYRVNDKKELSEIGIEEILKDPSNIVLIEWADRVRKILPKGAIWVKFIYGKERDERKIIID